MNGTIILYAHNAPDDVLFKLLLPYCLHKVLAQGSPYLNNNDGVSKAYVTECMDIAADIYHCLDLGSELLVVYEDCYSENNQEEIHFVESCLKGVGSTEVYSFSWKFRPMEGPYPPEVLRFADAVEAFYKSCSPKVLPKDEIDRERYQAFWKEWHKRRNIK